MYRFMLLPRVRMVQTCTNAYIERGYKSGNRSILMVMEYGVLQHVRQSRFGCEGMREDYAISEGVI
jgi:hypothetical protein